MAVTIQDVAERAGVSKATVSYVLSGSNSAIKITEATRERIHSAVRELNYRPNALARGLSRKRTDTVTLVLQFPSIFCGWSGFTSEMMRGATEATIQLGYDLMLHTKYQPDLNAEVSALTDGRADGALLIRDRDDPLILKLTEFGFPCIQIFGSSSSEAVWYVDCDNVLGGELATNTLIELGHRNLLYLAGTSRSSVVKDRYQGFHNAVYNAVQTKNEPISSQILEVMHPKDNQEQLREILTSENRPTGVFAWSDEVAVHLMAFARQIGLRVPEDLSVIGFDSTELCRHTNPTLTSIRQPIVEMANFAVHLLIRRLQGEVDLEKQHLFPPALEMRNSCRSV